MLTGPISAVSAGQYLAGLISDLSWDASTTRCNGATPRINYFAAAFGVLVTGYFWWKNIQGIHESSEKALRIMQITTVMVVLLIGWCVLTLIMHPTHLPPFPSHANIKMDHESLGWLYHCGWRTSPGCCCWWALDTPCWP